MERSVIFADSPECEARLGSYRPEFVKHPSAAKRLS